MHDCISVQARVASVSEKETLRLDFSSLNIKCSGCQGICFWRFGSYIDIKSALQVGIGDFVTVSIDRKNLMFGTLLLHGLPFFSLLLGAALGSATLSNDAGTLLGAFAGLMFGLLVLRNLTKTMQLAPIVTKS